MTKRRTTVPRRLLLSPEAFHSAVMRLPYVPDLPEAEYERLIANTQDISMFIFLKIWRAAGGDRADILAIRRSDVDLERGVIRVRSQGPVTEANDE